MLKYLINCFSAKAVRNQQTPTVGITGSSPRKRNNETEVQGVPSVLRNGSINIRSKVQICCQSPKPRQIRLETKPSPMKKDLKHNEELKNEHKSKSYTVTGVVKLNNLRYGNSTKALFIVVN